MRQLKRSVVMGTLLAFLSGCGTVGFDGLPASGKATISPPSATYRDLVRLPPPKGKIAVAAYGFRDLTGQFKPQPDSNLSTVLTQGATSLLVKTLLDSDWFVPVERENLQNLLTERRIVRAVEPSGASAAAEAASALLPSLVSAQLLIEGGIVGYESNVRTGGAGAKYLGIGSSVQYRKDQVTVNLRAVDIRSGRVLSSVLTTKSVMSRQVDTNVFRYVKYQTLLEVEAGYSQNDPVQMALLDAVEAGVIHLIVQGLERGLWATADPADVEAPVFARYRNEQRAVGGAMASEGATRGNPRERSLPHTPGARAVQPGPALAGVREDSSAGLESAERAAPQARDAGAARSAGAARTAEVPGTLAAESAARQDGAAGAGSAAPPAFGTGNGTAVVAKGMTGPASVAAASTSALPPASSALGTAAVVVAASRGVTASSVQSAATSVASADEPASTRAADPAGRRHPGAARAAATAPVADDRVQATPVADAGESRGNEAAPTHAPVEAESAAATNADPEAEGESAQSASPAPAPGQPVARSLAAGKAAPADAAVPRATAGESSGRVPTAPAGDNMAARAERLVVRTTQASDEPVTQSPTTAVATGGPPVDDDLPPIEWVVAPGAERAVPSSAALRLARPVVVLPQPAAALAGSASRHAGDTDAAASGARPWISRAELLQTTPPPSAGAR